MTLTQTSVGIGWSVERQRVRLRNGSGSDLTEGDIITIDGQGGGVAVDLAAAQGNKFHRWSTAVDLSGDVDQTMYPIFVTAEPVLAGRLGNFWLSHPEILMASTTGGVNQDGLALVPNTVAPLNEVLALLVDVDVNTFARVCGFSLEAEDATMPNMVTGCFDGIHFGGVGI